MRIHHRARVVSDLERSVAFYVGHFGFEMGERVDFDGERLAFLELGGRLLRVRRDRAVLERRTVGLLHRPGRRADRTD